MSYLDLSFPELCKMFHLSLPLSPQPVHAPRLPLLIPQRPPKHDPLARLLEGWAAAAAAAGRGRERLLADRRKNM